MYRFALPLEKGEDPSSGQPVVGFSINDMFIFDPYLSECGRFAVDPTVTYGLTKEDADHLVDMNHRLEEATQAALDAGCATLLQTLDLPSEARGDGYFRPDVALYLVAQALRDFLVSEYTVAASR